MGAAHQRREVDLGLFNGNARRKYNTTAPIWHVPLTAAQRLTYNAPMRTGLAIGMAISTLLALAGCLDRADRPQPLLPSPQAATNAAPATAASKPANIPNRQSPPETPTPAPFVEGPIVYGRSVKKRPLVAYRLGRGPIARALIGGLHGGYEWNTTALMSETLDYLRQSSARIPAGVTLYIVPLANPDGAVAGSDAIVGRMNANGVDLNRNWDYRWQMTATHGARPVFAGRGPFSEPETAALRDFILDRGISAAVFYHSAGGVVFSGAGRDTSKTVDLATFMAGQTGYRYAPEGVPGQITTGDAIDWLTAHGVAAVEIELSTHTDLDGEPNLRAVLAFLRWDLPPSSRFDRP
jgi:hypothetical protein